MVGLRNQALPTRACVVFLYQSIFLQIFNFYLKYISRDYEKLVDKMREKDHEEISYF